MQSTTPDNPVRVWGLRAVLAALALFLWVPLLFPGGYDRSEAREQKARTDVYMIADHVRSWLVKHGWDEGLPTTADLETPDESGRSHLTEVPLDPWEKPYRIVVGEKPDTFVVVSVGPDRMFGTADDIRRGGRVRRR